VGEKKESEIRILVEWGGRRRFKLPVERRTGKYGDLGGAGRAFKGGRKDGERRRAEEKWLKNRRLKTKETKQKHRKRGGEGYWGKDSDIFLGKGRKKRMGRKKSF